MDEELLFFFFDFLSRLVGIGKWHDSVPGASMLLFPFSIDLPLLWYGYQRGSARSDQEALRQRYVTSGMFVPHSVDRLQRYIEELAGWVVADAIDARL